MYLELARAGRSERRRLTLPAGTLVRAALRASGCAPEGSAVLEAGVPVPLDMPIERSVRLLVVPTFSGG